MQIYIVIYFGDYPPILIIELSDVLYRINEINIQYGILDCKH